MRGLAEGANRYTLMLDNAIQLTEALLAEMKKRKARIVDQRHVADTLSTYKRLRAEA